MPGVEGMWLMRSTEVLSNDIPRSPGIVILETGRLFGGDSIYYHIGNYNVDGGAISGQVRSRTHTIHDNVENVFGMKGQVDYTVEFTASFQGDNIVGTMQPEGELHLTQNFTMIKLSDLPG